MHATLRTSWKTEGFLKHRAYDCPVRVSTANISFSGGDPCPDLNLISWPLRAKLHMVNPPQIFRSWTELVMEVHNPPRIS